MGSNPSNHSTNLGDECTHADAYRHHGRQLVVRRVLGSQKCAHHVFGIVTAVYAVRVSVKVGAAQLNMVEVMTGPERAVWAIEAKDGVGVLTVCCYNLRTGAVQSVGSPIRDRCRVQRNRQIQARSILKLRDITARDGMG